MADGDSVLTSTSQFGIDADGKRVLFATGEDCPCCKDGVCGECHNLIVGDATLDLTGAGFAGTADGYYTDCGTECTDLNAMIVLTQESDCMWRYTADPFCTFWNTAWPAGMRGNDASRLFMILQIAYLSGAWSYVLHIEYEYNAVAGGLFPSYHDFLQVQYRVATGTNCSGSKTLTKYGTQNYPYQNYFGLAASVGLACSSGGDWEWPATIPLSIP